MSAELTNAYLARLIRERAEACFDSVQSRADLQRCARLYCLAFYVEQDSETAALFSILAPTQQGRPFPGEEFWELVETWAQEPPYNLRTLVAELIRAETGAAVDSELATL